MTQKLTIGLTLLLAASLVWLASSFINVVAAGNKVAGDKIVLALPAETLAGQAAPTAKLQINQQVVTQTSTYLLYLPIVFRSFCANSSFSYNETIRYNLEIINIENGWLSCYQGQDITVAVVDSGVNLSHSDLEANIVTGKTFVTGTSSADDDNGHGSHVAGIIAAVNNNGGVIGVAPKASIMPVKVLDKTGSGWLFDVADGIEWAADHGAKVINLSLASVSDSATLEEAVDYAYNQGVLVVAAGGNCGGTSYALNGCSYQNQPVYPAAYSNVMAVASTDSSDARSSFSNQGSYIEIAAPGSSIYSTYLSNGYATLSGTSMAAPHVAGLAALIWSQNSGWSNQQVRVQIRNTAQNLGTSGWDSQFGYGRIDAASAMAGTTSTSAVKVKSVQSSPAAAAIQAPYFPGEILLKLKTGFTVNDVIDQAQIGTAEVKVADTIDQIKVQKLAVTAGQEQTWLTRLRNSTGVEYAELNYEVTAQ